MRLIAAVVGLILAGSVDWRSHRQNAGRISVKLKLTATLFALIVTAMTTHVAAAVINFDNGTAPTAGPELVKPSDVDGVHISFTNATYVSYSLPGVAGPLPISGILGIQLISEPCCSPFSIIATFSDPANSQGAVT